MIKSRLKATFSGAMGDGTACALLVQPDNTDQTAEKLEALARAALRNYRRVCVILDDAACGDTAEESMDMARAWLERNRDRIDDCGISLESMVRWSQFPFAADMRAELKKLYDGSRDMRQAMHSIAIRSSNPEADIQSIREALPKLFKRVAGFIYMRAVCDMPVIGGPEGMPPDSYIFDKARNSPLSPGLLRLPDFVQVTYSEGGNEKPSALPAAMPAATILQFQPRKA